MNWFGKPEDNMKRDAALLHHYIASPRPEAHRAGFGPSLLEELTRRGYDIETFRFYIRKKQ